MKNSNPVFTILSGIILFCLSMSMFTGCAQFSQYSNANLEADLQNKIEQFNKRFEGKMMDLSADYLPRNKRRQFLIDSLKIKENVAFYDSSILDIQLFKNELPVQIKPTSPENAFNRATVSMRYQVSTLPSNQLKTIFIDQQWVFGENGWVVDPKLEKFLK